ncbi:hypothetical protein ACIA8R_32510 [Nonomuraea sp. NPDC051191]|uniref:hypothetical protein n=1 Tax=Nonomuraea sp. NPDC051191 TaxID=3364372 RepID=UPI0037B0D07C
MGRPARRASTSSAGTRARRARVESAATQYSQPLTTPAVISTTCLAASGVSLSS